MEFSGGGEHDEGDLGITENRQLLGFLENPIPSLRISHLSVGCVLYPPDLNLSTPHLSLSLSLWVVGT